MELTVTYPRKRRSGRRGGEVCPSLLLHRSAVCDVSEKLYLPSSYQVQEFCTTDQHRRCPLRKAALPCCDSTALGEQEPAENVPAAR